ncbi:MAG: peptide chain release factor N(5)-glutamine methyltransferase [Flavobacterium sp.]|nr:peptide chain release factor N(5)-glutamine methyltransferase [Flavobacterium sp.]
MKIKHYQESFLNQIAPIFDYLEAQSFFYIILEHIHHLKRIDLALNHDLEMTEKQLQEWVKIVAALQTKKPIQYILGETEFYGLKFIVDQNTLIPRPETEELVQLILNFDLSIFSNLKILDIGTGSGCIAIALAKNLPNASVYALDVSDTALKTAKLNAQHNKVNITFIHQSVLETSNLQQQFSIIVSNPPYVRNLEKNEINKNVLDFEPHLALFVDDDDALLFYRKIAQLAKVNLIKNGLLFFEINQYLASVTIDLLKSLNFNNIQLYKDVYNNDRMISCSL